MTPLLATLSGTHVLLVVLVLLLLFGAQKIPQLMRSVGSGLSEFKKGLKDGEQAAAPEAPVPSPQPAGTKPASE
jgi:sec-independent protein translocase protein TatA